MCDPKGCWRATFFVKFMAIDNYPISLPEENISETLKSIISNKKYQHIEYLDLIRSKSKDKLIWIATVKADQEESESSTSKRDQALEDFREVVTYVVLRSFILTFKGPYCNVPWIWIEY